MSSALRIGALLLACAAGAVGVATWLGHETGERGSDANVRGSSRSGAGAEGDGLALDAGAAEITEVGAGDRIASDAPTESLRLRLLHADGRPVLNRRLKVRWSGTAPPKAGAEPESRLRDRSATTDTNGVFRIRLADDVQAWTGRALDVELTSGSENGVGSVRVPDVLTPGEHDLGDLTLGAAPLVVAGTVVDSTGRPLPSVEVRVDCQATMLGNLAFANRKFHTDAGGRFELRDSTVAVGPLVVSATRRSLRSESSEVAYGTRDVVLTVYAPGFITGQVLYGVDTPPNGLDIVAWRGDEPPEEFAYTDVPTRSGEFRLQVPPGSYSVAVRSGGLEFLHIEPGVLVHESRTMRPPLLDPLDLRGTTRAFGVRVKSTDRNAVSATVHYRPSGLVESEWATTTVNARGTIVTQADAIDLRIESHGLKPTTRTGVSSDIVITLEPGYSILVALTPPDGFDGIARIEVAGQGLGYLVEDRHRMKRRLRNPGFRYEKGFTLSQPGEIDVWVHLTPPHRTADAIRALLHSEGFPPATVGASTDGPAITESPPTIVLHRTLTVRDLPDQQHFPVVATDQELAPWSQEASGADE